MNWAELDAVYAFANANGLPFKFHTLVWGSQQPSWLSALTPEEQLAEIDEWMGEVAARYPGIDLIDVVNEPMNTPPSYAAALGGAGVTGYDWVIKAFEMARGHFPAAELIVNEYNTVVLPEFTANYLQIVNLLKDRGLSRRHRRAGALPRARGRVGRGREPRCSRGDGAPDLRDRARPEPRERRAPGRADEHVVPRPLAAPVGRRRHALGLPPGRDVAPGRLPPPHGR